MLEKNVNTLSNNYSYDGQRSNQNIVINAFKQHSVTNAVTYY